MTIHLTPTQVRAVLRKHFEECHPGKMIGPVMMDSAGTAWCEVMRERPVPVERARELFDAMRDVIQRVP